MCFSIRLLVLSIFVSVSLIFSISVTAYQPDAPYVFDADKNMRNSGIIKTKWHRKN